MCKSVIKMNVTAVRLEFYSPQSKVIFKSRPTFYFTGPDHKPESAMGPRQVKQLRAMDISNTLRACVQDCGVT